MWLLYISPVDNMSPITSHQFEPAYLKLHRSGALKERIEKAWALLESCTLCPRNCRVDRLAGERGFCRTGRLPIVSSWGPHFGEERPLVGRGGSGTIFFTYCNLGCVFCQNYDISHLGSGEEISTRRLGEAMLELQQMGCHNINFVTPTHFVPQILDALPLAIEAGLSLPLVYNSGGYDSVETLRLLDGIFDIYMPDFKYSDRKVSARFSNAPDYPEAAKAALREMHRQVGELQLDERGIARRGLLIRHLVLPEDLAGTKEAMQFIAQQISPQTYVNVMEQYRPCHQASEHPPLDRPITGREFREAVEMALQEGLNRLEGLS